MTLEPLLSALGVVALLGGCALATIGVIGLLLKPNLFDQLHVAGLVTGPGVILVLVASLGTGSAEIVTSAILVIAFVLVTSSISTHVIAQAGARRYETSPGDGTRLAEDAAAAATAPGDEPVVSHLLRTGMRIVVAYDGSPAARTASDLAAAIDWPAGSVVRLVRVTHDPALLGRPSPDLDAAADAIRRPGIEVETSVLGGEPADVIAEELSAFDAHLLITGSRRRSAVQSVLGASASGDIVDRAGCPVLVARSTALRTVMLTTDGSSQSAVATAVVARWPIFDLARVHVVTVAGDGDVRAGHHVVDATAAVLMDAGRDVVTQVLEGRAAERIVDAATLRSVDLIVIGSRGLTGLGRTIVGSLAGEVLAAATCSVLIVRPASRRAAPSAADDDLVSPG